METLGRIGGMFGVLSYATDAVHDKLSEYSEEFISAYGFEYPLVSSEHNRQRDQDISTATPPNAGTQIIQMLVDIGVLKSGQSLTEAQISSFTQWLFRSILTDYDLCRKLNLTQEEYTKLLGSWVIEVFGSPEAAKTALPGIIETIKGAGSPASRFSGSKYTSRRRRSGRVRCQCCRQEK